MKIILGDKKSNACGCSGIDGANKTEVKAFQNWAKTAKGAFLGSGGADGIYGPITKAIYASYGAEWEAMQNTKPFEVKGKPLADKTVPSADKTVPPIDKPIMGIKLVDKVKGLSLPIKITIGVGAALVLGIVIYKLIK